MRFSTLTIIVLPLILSAACVSSGKYEAALAERDAMRQSLGSSQDKIATDKDELMKLEARKQYLQQELSDSQAQMATLRKIEAETKRRNEIYAQFVNRLKNMIDGGQLTVSIEQGRIVINLPNNVLFKSGRASLNPEGKEALAQIAMVLGHLSDRRFQIEIGRASCRERV